MYGESRKQHENQDPHKPASCTAMRFPNPVITRVNTGSRARITVETANREHVDADSLLPTQHRQKLATSGRALPDPTQEYDGIEKSRSKDIYYDGWDDSYRPQHPPFRHSTNDYRGDGALDPGYDSQLFQRHRSRSRGRSPAPQINVYNTNDGLPYPPYPSSSGPHRASPPSSPESRGRGLSPGALSAIEDMALEHRYRSRARGLTDASGYDPPPVGPPGWKQAQMRQAQVDALERARLEEERLNYKSKLDNLEAKVKKKREEEQPQRSKRHIIAEYKREQREHEALEADRKKRIIAEYEREQQQKEQSEIATGTGRAEEKAKQDVARERQHWAQSKRRFQSRLGNQTGASVTEGQYYDVDALHKTRLRRARAEKPNTADDLDALHEKNWSHEIRLREARAEEADMEEELYSLRKTQDLSKKIQQLKTELELLWKKHCEVERAGDRASACDIKYFAIPDAETRLQRVEATKARADKEARARIAATRVQRLMEDIVSSSDADEDVAWQDNNFQLRKSSTGSPNTLSPIEAQPSSSSSSDIPQGRSPRLDKHGVRESFDLEQRSRSTAEAQSPSSASDEPVMPGATESTALILHSRSTSPPRSRIHNHFDDFAQSENAYHVRFRQRSRSSHESRSRIRSVARKREEIEGKIHFGAESQREKEREATQREENRIAGEHMLERDHWQKHKKGFEHEPRPHWVERKGLEDGIGLEWRWRKYKDEEEEQEGSSADEYDFTLPRMPQDSVEAVGHAPEVAIDAAMYKPENILRSGTRGDVTESMVIQSSWVGSAYDRGALAAKVATLKSDENGLQRQSEPLITWFHMERARMSFEEFIAVAQRLPKLQEQQQRDVNSLLRDVQKKFEKQRQHGRDLEPNGVTDTFMMTGDDESSAPRSSVMFLCFPYFCLESYNANDFMNLTSGSPMHPQRPLLQGFYHSTSQKRELTQAVTRLPGTPERHCLHLSQTWCLVVDDDRMLTCSRLSHDHLCEGAVSKEEVAYPTPDNAVAVKVSLNRSRALAVPASDTVTWPRFTAVFDKIPNPIYDNNLIAQFYAGAQQVTSSSWPPIRDSAKKASTRLELKELINYVPHSGFAPTHIVPRDGAAQRNADGGSGADVARNTASEAHLEGQSDPRTPSGDEHAASDTNALHGYGDRALEIFTHASSTSSINSLAKSLHKVLSTSRPARDKSLYCRCQEAQASSVERQLSSTCGCSNCAIAFTAIYMFNFFWPMSLDHQIARKYWGAIAQALGHNNRSTYSSNALLKYVVDELQTQVIPLMESLAADYHGAEHELITLPDAFQKAFLHTVRAWMLIAQIREEDISSIDRRIVCVQQQLAQGRQALAARLNSWELQNLEICGPSSLLSLLLKRLASDVMHGRPDVASTYNDYFNQLDFSIIQDPTPRRHQERLRYFLQEIDAILGTLQYQMSVLKTFSLSLEQRYSDARQSRILAALGDDRRNIVVNECKALIAGRIDRLKGLKQRAEELGEWHRNEIETNKDRQESAIVAFTVVTIVFLPLSFVSSVFGMNTTDIRDMPQTQWTFWIVSVPLTLLVVVGSMWWAGEFEGFGKWLAKTSLGRSNTSGWRHISRYTANDGKREKSQDPLPRFQAPLRRRTTYPHSQ